MPDFAIHDETGKVITRLTCRLADAEALAARKGGTVFHGLVPPGHVVIDGVPVAPADGPPSDALRAELKAGVDTAAGQLRSLFITTVAGQELVYAEKRAEAERIMAGDIANVPHVSAEAAGNGKTLMEQATIILAMASAWRAVSVLIETRRLAAKAAIDAAETENTARSAAVIDWSDVRAMV